MDWKLRKRAIVLVAICAALVTVGRSEPRASYRESGLSPLQRVIRILHDRDLTRDTTDDQVAGYYEGLLAGRPATLLGRSRDSESYRFRGDYLYYEPKPLLNVADYADPRLRHVTNSHGMPDIEYAIERRPRTRRLAILGDSVTRGQGAPFGDGFEALLERDLNENYAGSGIDTYELLNFSSTGYRLTQMVDIALEKAPAFAPDVYVVCLTRLSVSRKWGDHIAQLVYDGIDLKYPFLRDMAAKAKLDGRDPPATMDAKLAAYRLPAIRWAMTSIKEQARSDGAEVLAVLVPTASRPDELERTFTGVREVLHELDVPMIDLLDTFNDADDLLPFMVEAGNIHPNGTGHRRIFEHLRQQIAAGGRAPAIVRGPHGASRDSDTR